MFSAVLLTPSDRSEFSREGREVFEVKSHHEIDVPCESPEVNEAEQCSSSNDGDLGVKPLCDDMQLREVFQLLIVQHGRGPGTLAATPGLPREHGDRCCS